MLATPMRMRRSPRFRSSSGWTGGRARSGLRGVSTGRRYRQTRLTCSCSRRRRVTSSSCVFTSPTSTTTRPRSCVPSLTSRSPRRTSRARRYACATQLLSPWQRPEITCRTMLFSVAWNDLPFPTKSWNASSTWVGDYRRVYYNFM